jgi:hypothetical protein
LQADLNISYAPFEQSMVISWRKVSSTSYILKIDGASKGNPGCSRAGGIIRTKEGATCK